MVSRTLASALVAICVAILVAPFAAAQDKESGSATPLPSLAERLEQFRQDLLGPPVADQKRGEADRAASQQGLQRRPAQGTQRSRTTRPVEGGPPRTELTQPPSAMPSVHKPRHLEVQSARKAQPSGGLIPVTTPAERGVPQAQQPARSRVDIDELADESRAPQEAPQASPGVGQDEVPAVARRVERAPRDDTALFSTSSPVLSVAAVGPRTVRVGSEARFTIKIRNSGEAASDVMVMVNVPEHAEVASANATSGTVPGTAPQQKGAGLEWKIPRLDAKSVETLNLVLVPHKSDPMELGVQFTYAPESSRLVVEVQEPMLEMSISGPDDVLYGDTRIYKLILSNPGNGDAQNVVIGLLPVGSSTEGIASHKLGTLPAGQSRTVDVELTARQPGSITIKAQAYADGGLHVEAAEQVLVRRASLQVEVEAPRMAFAGTPSSYRVKLVNSGNAAAGDVRVAAMLPPEAHYVASSGGGRYEAQQRKVEWAVGTLQPGAEQSFDMQCALGTPGDNRTQFVATAAGDVSTSTTSSTQVEALADLKIELRDPPGPVAVGSEADYEVVVRNRGSAPAEQVEVIVFFSEGLEAISVDGPQHEISAGQVLFQPVAMIGANETLTIKMRAKADRGGHHVFRAESYCNSLGTKLAAEEATYFYGEAAPAARQEHEADEPRPTPAAESQAEPQADDDEARLDDDEARVGDDEARLDDDPPPVPN